MYILQSTLLCYSLTISSSNSCYIHTRVQNASVGSKSIVEFSELLGEIRVGEKSILSRCYIDYSQVASCTLFQTLSAITGTPTLTFPDHISLQVVPIKLEAEVRYVSYFMSTTDNIKGNALFGVPFGKIMHLVSKTADLSTATPWTAQFYPACKTREESIICASYVMHNISCIVEGKLPNLQNDIRNFIEAQTKVSFDQCVETLCDTQQIIVRQAELDVYLVLLRIADLFNGSVDVKQWKNTLSAALEYLWYSKMDCKAIVLFLEQHTDSAPLSRMRLYRSLAYLFNTAFESKNDAYAVNMIESALGLKQKAAVILRDIILTPFVHVHSSIDELTLHTKAGYMIPQLIGENLSTTCTKATCELPLRINLSGGWTDTPPYTIEKGGIVLNVAIRVNDIRPVVAAAERIDMHAFVFQMGDEQVQVKSFTELLMYDDHGDAFALHKAVITHCLFPGFAKLKSNVEDLISIIQEIGDLNYFFSKHGFGIKLSTNVIGIPKGSGLGTSSILALAWYGNIII